MYVVMWLCNRRKAFAVANTNTLLTLTVQLAKFILALGKVVAEQILKIFIYNYNNFASRVIFMFGASK